MNEQEALSAMVAPGTRRPGKYREGVIQIHVTRACDKACFNCTQGSNLGGRNTYIPPAMFERALQSLSGYWGVVGMFGGNPAMHPEFVGLCELMRKYFPMEQRGLWCNSLLTEAKGQAARETFDPRVSNLNVHMDSSAWDGFRRWWPESRPFGLDKDSRHSPPYVAMRDVLKTQCSGCGGKGWHTAGANDPMECGRCDGTGTVYNSSLAWELISGCDINKHWSAMVGMFRGHLRAWFCEIAGAQSILHQDESDYPDTGVNPQKYVMSNNAVRSWWELPMSAFADQVRKHCHDCGVPLRGHGELAQAQDGAEQVSEAHRGVYVPKRKDRRVELVTLRSQLGKPLGRMTQYLENA